MLSFLSIYLGGKLLHSRGEKMNKSNNNPSKIPLFLSLSLSSSFSFSTATATATATATITMHRWVGKTYNLKR